MRSTYTLILLIGLFLSACSQLNERTQVSFVEEEVILTSHDRDSIKHLFDSCYNCNVYIYTSALVTNYKTALEKEPFPDMSWSERMKLRESIVITYYASNDWLMVNVPQKFKNTYASKYSVPIYQLQDTTINHLGARNTIISASKLMAEMMQKKQNIFVIMAQSVTSVIDYFVEPLIVPSDNILHLILFRLPLYFALFLLAIMHSLGWTIALVVLGLILIAIYSIETKQHIWAFRVSYIFLCATFICLIFLSIPSFDTLMAIHDMGANRACCILQSMYCNASATQSTWFGATIFIVLFIVNFCLKNAESLDHYLNNIDTFDWNKKKIEEKILATIGMFIVAFMTPKCLVWAVNAYLLQQMVGNIAKNEKNISKKQVGSVTEFKIIAGFVTAYLITIIVICLYSPLAMIEQRIVFMLANHIHVLEIGLGLQMCFVPMMTVVIIMTEYFNILGDIGTYYTKSSNPTSIAEMIRQVYMQKKSQSNQPSTRISSILDRTYARRREEYKTMLNNMGKALMYFAIISICALISALSYSGMMAMELLVQ